LDGRISDFGYFFEGDQFMNKIVYLILTTVIAVLFAGCTPPAANTNTANINSNANSKPAAAPPTVAALKELETKAFEAWKNHDGKFFEGFLDEKFQMGGMGQTIDKAAAVKMMSESKCVVNSYAISDEKMIPIGTDNAVIISKFTVDATCDGKKEPSPVIAASVYTCSGDAWKGVYHNEVAIVDPKAATSAPKLPEMKRPPNSNTASNSIGSSASNSNASNSSNSNMSNTSPSTRSDMTAAWHELEKKGWESWRTKDAKWYEDNLASNVVFVDLFGQLTATKADIVKMWTTENKCEIRSTSVTEPSSISLGKDAGIFMYKGSADGTCEGMTIKPLYGTTVVVNEGGTWKAAFIIENPI